MILKVGNETIKQFARKVEEDPRNGIYWTHKRRYITAGIIVDYLVEFNSRQASFVCRTYHTGNPKGYRQRRAFNQHVKSTLEEYKDLQELAATMDEYTQGINELNHILERAAA